MIYKTDNTSTGFSCKGNSTDNCQNNGQHQDARSVIDGLIEFLLQIQILAIELLGLQKPIMQKPLQLWIFVGQDISKATDIKQFTYMFTQAQKSLSAMTSKPSGIDRGHTFINQNHCHAKKQNLFTRANAALPSLGNRHMEVQLGEQALLLSCGL